MTKTLVVGQTSGLGWIGYVIQQNETGIWLKNVTILSPFQLGELDDPKRWTDLFESGVALEDGHEVFIPHANIAHVMSETPAVRTTAW